MAPQFLFVALTVFTTVLFFSRTSAQMNSACPTSMITTFAPCKDYMTNSSANGATPPEACCKSIKDLASNNKDCLCLMATDSLPIKLPINQDRAVALPKACSVSLECKGSKANGPSAAPSPANAASGDDGGAQPPPPPPSAASPSYTGVSSMVLGTVCGAVVAPLV